MTIRNINVIDVKREIRLSLCQVDSREKKRKGRMFHASHRIYAESSSTQRPLLLLDPLAAAEQARVITQDHMLASVLKEPLPELDEEPSFTRTTSPHLILDLECGPAGTWACDMAFHDPFCLVVGISALAPYVRQATASSQMQEQTRVQFLQMDIARELCCPITFTIINARFLRTFLPDTQWPRLLQESWRVLRPGGLLRLTECISASSNSPACTTLTHFYEQALASRLETYHAHIEAHQECNDLANTPFQHTRLFHLLQACGYCDIQEQHILFDFSAGTPYQDSMRTNAESFFYQMAPLLYQTTELTPARFEDLFEQMRAEMSSPTFKGHWIISRVYASRPGGNVQ